MQNTNRTILTVGELNSEVNQLLTRGFPLLWVEGEISNLVRPASGHLYFSLKDDKAQIRCAIFRNRNSKLNLKPENGMKVLIRGRVGLYEPRGDYQLIAEHMEDAGVGKLQREFEKLKTKLSDAGLFAEEHKKELPEYPKTIGVITSPTGAAVKDILNVLKRRSPHTNVLIYPVAVQGDSSKLEIESAIRKANADGFCDVLILARGGGSIEDLWSFNEENVAKAIYHCDIPLICGVGHEIDFTIADFVADVRAPTPSAAAELVTADSSQLLTDVLQTQLWLEQTLKREIKQKRQQFEWLDSRLALQKPSLKIQQQAQRLDELDSRLSLSINNAISSKQQQYKNVNKRLQLPLLEKKVTQQHQQLSQYTLRLKHSIKAVIKRDQSRMGIVAAQLDSISPLKTLDRGYSITKDAQKQTLVTSVKQIKKQQRLHVQLKDGIVDAEVLASHSIHDKTS